VAAVALLLGADRIMDSMRVSVNLLGSCIATFVVANWEGQLDKGRARAVLDGKPVRRCRTTTCRTTTCPTSRSCTSRPRRPRSWPEHPQRPRTDGLQQPLTLSRLRPMIPSYGH
jgi:hypothetical protein